MGFCWLKVLLLLRAAQYKLWNGIWSVMVIGKGIVIIVKKPLLPHFLPLIYLMIVVSLMLVVFRNEVIITLIRVPSDSELLGSIFGRASATIYVVSRDGSRDGSGSGGSSAARYITGNWAPALAEVVVLATRGVARLLKVGVVATVLSKVSIMSAENEARLLEIKVRATAGDKVRI